MASKKKTKNKKQKNRFFHTISGVNSGVTEGTVGTVPPDIFHREIFADLPLPGKEGKEEFERRFHRRLTESIFAKEKRKPYLKTVGTHVYVYNMKLWRNN